MGKSKNVLISIIVPLYNEEQNILKLIKNISKQTFKSFEVVFIDDGSLDNTAELINKNAGKYFRYQYYWKNNGGVGSARNFGIQISEGKYITFLDADDYYDETFLEKMFKKICLENTNFCFCGYNLNTQNGIKRIKTVFPKENLLQLYWLGKLKVHTDSWIIDKTFLLKNEIFFLETTNWGEDFYFFSKLLKESNNSSYVNEYLTYYSYDLEDNRLSVNSFDKLEKDVLLIKNVLELLEIQKDERLYRILWNYRLPTMIMNRLIWLLEDSKNRSKVEKAREKYADYVKVSISYGSSSFKQIIRYLQLFTLLKVNNRR